MNRHTQTILYHLLPVVFFLLATGVSVAPIVFDLADEKYWWGFVVAAVCMICFSILHRIRRHASAVEECFQVAVLVGTVSYWLPTVLFLLVPVWLYLIFRNLFSLRSFLSMLFGLAVVTVWAAVLIFFGWIDNPWADFFATKNLWAWIPTGSFSLAYIASTIARQNLRVR